MIIRGGTLRAGGYLATIAVSVASAAVLTRYLGVSDYGRYSAVFSVVMIISGLSEAGMTNAAVREYAIREGDERHRMMRSLLGLRLVIATLGMLVAVGFTLAAGYRGQLIIGAAFAGLAVVVSIFSGTLAVSLQARLRLGWVSLLDVVRALLTGIGLIALAAAGAGLALLLAVPLPVAVLILALTAVLVRHQVAIRPTFDRSAWRELLALTLPFAVVTVVGILYGYVNLPLVSLASSANETGLYGAAFRVFAVLAGIPALLVSAAFPLLARAARDDRDRLSYALQRMFEILLMLSGLLTLATAVGAHAAIAVIADPSEFGGAAGVLRLQAIALISTSGVALWGFALLSLHRTRELLIANLIGLTITVGLTLGLAPGFGAYGAAIASVAGDLILAATYAVALFRVQPDLRPKLAVAARVVTAAAVALLPLLVVDLPSSAAAALVVALYLGLLVLLRTIPPEVVEALRGLARGRGPSGA